MYDSGTLSPNEVKMQGRMKNICLAFWVSDELSAYKIQKYMQKSYLMHMLVVYTSFTIDKTVLFAVKLSIEEGWK